MPDRLLVTYVKGRIRGRVPYREAFNDSLLEDGSGPALNVSVHRLGLTAMIAEDALPRERPANSKTYTRPKSSWPLCHKSGPLIGYQVNLQLSVGIADYIKNFYNTALATAH